MKRDTIVPAKPKPVEVPLSLKSAVALINRHRIKEQRGVRQADAVLDLMAGTALELQEASEQIAVSYQKITANQMETPLRNSINAKRVVGQIRQQALARVDEGRAKAEAAIARLTHEMSPRPPKDMIGAVTAIESMEIRTALRGMQPNVRLKAVNDAILEGDEAFVYAALNSSVNLSGLTVAEQNLARDFWARHWHSETMQRVERLKAAQADADRGVALFDKWSNGVGSNMSAAIAAAEQSAKLAAEAADSLHTKSAAE